MLVIGTTATLLANVLALAQCDLKRIIAYSTCSHVGMMVSAIGTTSATIAMYHLVLHAFSKASLFMTAGCIMHSFCNEQDLRRYYACGSSLPVTQLVLTLSTLSLLGVPFFSGYFSKDAILHSM